VRALRDRDRESHCIGKLGLSGFARRGSRRGFYANKKRRDRGLRNENRGGEPRRPGNDGQEARGMAGREDRGAGR